MCVQIVVITKTFLEEIHYILNHLVWVTDHEMKVFFTVWVCVVFLIDIVLTAEAFRWIRTSTPSYVGIFDQERIYGAGCSVRSSFISSKIVYLINVQS